MKLCDDLYNFYKEFYDEVFEINTNSKGFKFILCTRGNIDTRKGLKFVCSTPSNINKQFKQQNCEYCKKIIFTDDYIPICNECEKELLK